MLSQELLEKEDLEDRKVQSVVAGVKGKPDNHQKTSQGNHPRRSPQREQPSLRLPVKNEQ